MVESSFGVTTESQSVQRAYTRFANYLWIVAGVLFILSLLAVYFKISGSGEVVTLRYNIVVGVSEIGDKNQLYKLPLTSFLIGAVNFALSKVHKTDQRILYLLTAMVTVALNAILLLAAIFLFRVN